MTGSLWCYVAHPQDCSEGHLVPYGIIHGAVPLKGSLSTEFLACMQAPRIVR